MTYLHVLVPSTVFMYSTVMLSPKNLQLIILSRTNAMFRCEFNGVTVIVGGIISIRFFLG